MILSLCKKSPLVGVALCGLAACGGGGAGTGTPAGPVSAPSGTTYLALSTSHASVAGQSLGGAGLRNAPGGVSVTAVSGTITGSQSAVQLGDGAGIITDADGFDGAGNLSDPSGAQMVRNTAPQLNSYDYLTVGQMSHTTGGPTTTLVVTGVHTNTMDMPSTGSASFSGRAVADEVTVGGYRQYTSETVQVSVTYAGGGSATLVGTGFGTQTGSANFDAIQITGMSISGANLSGGTVSTLSGGVPVTLYGTGASTAVQGSFFGYDPTTGGPDEVGGVFLVNGSSGNLMGYFVAD